MNPKRMWALFVARNYEFIRDKAGFGWNILFPFLIVAGFALIFSNDSRTEFKAGVYPLEEQTYSVEQLNIPEEFIKNKYIRIVPFKSHQQGIDKLVHHKIDILLKNSDEDFSFWISDSSPKGYIMEKLLKESLIPENLLKGKIEKKEIKGIQIRYIDWLFPGILGMNIMFSALFGVGYVIVRYRKTGVLKRLKATPVTAFEYLSAQLISRVLILLITSFIVWTGCDLMFSFKMNGSYFDAAIVFIFGTISLVSLGLIVAARGTSEEMANGLINFICWPMMFLSEVWFSLEGSSEWIKAVARIFPLTHFLSALRKIINDGVQLSEVSGELAVLAVTSLICLTIGSLLFSWTK